VSCGSDALRLGLAMAQLLCGCVTVAPNESGHCHALFRSDDDLTDRRRKRPRAGFWSPDKGSSRYQRERCEKLLRGSGGPSMAPAHWALILFPVL
jgi:hypothetical protein